jgi:hypothetical protein
MNIFQYLFEMILKHKESILFTIIFYAIVFTTYSKFFLPPFGNRHAPWTVHGVGSASLFMFVFSWIIAGSAAKRLAPHYRTAVAVSASCPILSRTISPIMSAGVLWAAIALVSR